MLCYCVVRERMRTSPSSSWRRNGPQHSTLLLVKSCIAIYIVLALLWSFFNTEEGGSLRYRTRLSRATRLQNTSENCDR